MKIDTTPKVITGGTTVIMIPGEDGEQGPMGPPGSGGSGTVTQAYTTVQDEGTPLTQRTTLNFVGAGVTATDDGTNTVVTIPGGSGSGLTQPQVLAIASLRA